MYAIFVSIKIKPGFRDRFIEASFGDAQGAVRDEPACFRFDILQNAEDPDQFHLYEVYENEAAMGPHRDSPHYKKWRETVQDWFEGETQRVVMSTVFPSDDGWRSQKPQLVNW
jgi:quinol monooxygenase YgiN